MVDVVLQGAWVLYRINKGEGDESLPASSSFLKTYAVFLKYSKEGRLSSSHVGNQNILSDVCYEVIKHYQVQSEHRHTQNPVNHLR